MKSIKYLILVVVCLVLCSGCVKYNATMDIKSNKSMDLSIIYAFDTSIFGEQKVLEDSNIEKLKNQGFSVSDYADDKMKGFTISKNFKNIDEVSNNEKMDYSLSKMLDEDSNSKIFQVKKGFFKNHYVASLSFNANDSELNGNSDSIVENTSDNESLDMNLDDFDYSSFTKNLDLSFKVLLPYNATSNNASTVNNDGKELIWNLSSDKQYKIEFEFDLYNTTNIIICGVVAILIISGVVTFVVMKKKNS